MKKSILIAALAASIALPSMAQSDQDVTYVEDTSQGLLINRMQDNWFITVQGGGNKVMTVTNNHRNFWNGVLPAMDLFVGKRFTPVFGARIGLNMLFTNQLSPLPFYDTDGSMHNGYYQNKFNQVGPVADFMVDLTNWIGGYKPSRRWGLVLYAGGGGYFTLFHTYKKLSDGKYESEGWKNMHDNILTLHGGIINKFIVNKHIEINLDFRYSFYDAHDGTYILYPDETRVNRTTGNLQAYLGLTYNFNRTGWSGPMVPICPEAQDCSPYMAALEDANAKISELETQLRACLDRPVQTAAVQEVDEHLATIYYPINVSKLTATDKVVLEGIAAVMQNNPNQRYTITGWADNYTGNDEINTRLRHARANGVKDALLQLGVNPDQLDVTINAGNLCDLGEKCVSLDRAVTIDENK